LTKHIRHVRHHAKKHHESHERLKDLLKRTLLTEKILGTFLTTFVLAISSIIIFFNWGNIVSFFGSDDEFVPPIEEPIVINGFLTGMVSTYRVNGQAADEYIRLVRQIPTSGTLTGLESSNAIGKGKKEEAESKLSAFMGSVILTTDLSKGHHLTAMRGGGMLLQKSVLATFYLGEKSVDLSSTLQTDAQLLSKIRNTLGVDIFAYLNQSADRATTLDNYLHLLDTLLNTARERSADLTSKINFLNVNFSAQDRAIELTEDAFFQNLEIFDGENAETELAEFIGLTKEQSEVRAKIGAYQGLKDYYDFFIPQIENLARAIRANRDPLIAGVKVVEIQNMTLPLIIRER